MHLQKIRDTEHKIKMLHKLLQMEKETLRQLTMPSTTTTTIKAPVPIDGVLRAGQVIGLCGRVSIENTATLRGWLQYVHATQPDAHMLIFAPQDEVRAGYTAWAAEHKMSTQVHCLHPATTQTGTLLALNLKAHILDTIQTFQEAFASGETSPLYVVFDDWMTDVEIEDLSTLPHVVLLYVYPHIMHLASAMKSMAFSHIFLFRDKSATSRKEAFKTLLPQCKRYEWDRWLSNQCLLVELTTKNVHAGIQ